MEGSSNRIVEIAPARPLPEVPADGWLGGLRQSGAFLRDWQGFLARCRDQTRSTAFRMHLGGPVVAVIDGVGIRATRDPARFARMYGFGPRRPSPAVIGSVVPTVFTDDELHDRRKGLHLALYREAWPELDRVLSEVVDEALPGWERGEVRLLGPELERMVARVLFRWLLGADPPLDDVRTVGTSVIPFRPVPGLPLPVDRRVRRAYDRLVAFVLGSPRAGRLVAAAAGCGVSPAELSRDLVFTLTMNAWAALSGALVSAVAELTRHPEHRDRLAAHDPDRSSPSRVADFDRSSASDLRDPHAANVVREVLRLHPPAPVTFAVAREDGPLETAWGDVELRAGDVVMGVLAMSHRDPQVFDDPDRFDPDRYADQGFGGAAGATTPPGEAGLPFGAPAVQPSPARWGRLADEVLWTGGPEGLEPTRTDRVCAGRAAALRILERLVVAIARGRWALTRRPEWGTRLTPRGVPDRPLELVAYRRGPAGLAWTGPGGEASRGDRLRMWTVALVRAVQQRSVEVWSARTYRTPARPGPAPEVAPTAEVLGAPDVPPFLVVPRRLPAHGAMGPRYVVPYYYAAGVLFGALERAGLDPNTPFRPNHPALRRFPDPPEGWGNLQEDDAFGRLRLQGPNPYLLAGDGDGFVVDYRRAFDGIAPPVVCRFEVDGTALRPTAIRIGDRSFGPASDGWRRAKLVANALEARMTVFGEHLGRTHLVIAQAFALARFRVPPDHPLRPFLDLHGFATLQVNDFAYKLLVSPSSYFVRSGFVSRDQVFRIFRNLWPTTDAVRLLPEQDIARRGIDRVPEHPYVREAVPAWEALRAYTGRVVDAYFADDGAVRADPALASWDQALRAVLPRPAAELLPAPRTRAGLADLLAAWVYNNVAHEVCGDFSPYVSGSDEEQARLVDFDRLRMGMEGGPASLAGVFLMKQGAHAGLFDTRGNGMLRVDPLAVTTCPAHAGALARLQAELRGLSEQVRARNAGRVVPLLRMDPQKWELSIGF